MSMVRATTAVTDLTYFVFYTGLPAPGNLIVTLCFIYFFFKFPFVMVLNSSRVFRENPEAGCKSYMGVTTMSWDIGEHRG